MESLKLLLPARPRLPLRPSRLSGIGIAPLLTLILILAAGLYPAGLPRVAAAPPQQETPSTAPSQATVAAEPRSPGRRASYQVTFINGSQPLRPLQDAIVLTVHRDVRVPPQLPPTAVQVRYQNADQTEVGLGAAASVSLTNQDAPNLDTTLTIYPTFAGPDGEPTRRAVPAGAQVTLTLPALAGLSNPTEGGAYSWLVATSIGGEATPSVAARHPEAAVRRAHGQREPDQYYPAPDSFDPAFNGLLVDREIELSQDEAGRGDAITVFGRGYRNDTTLTFWRDGNLDGRRDLDESVLCRVTVSRYDDGYCTFQISRPPFAPGVGNCTLDGPADCNLVNATDGREQSATVVRDAAAVVANSLAEAPQTLELKPQVIGLVGTNRQLELQLADFPPGSITSLTLGGVKVPLPSGRSYRVPASGSLVFTEPLPPGVRQGTQVLRITVNAADGQRREVLETLLIPAISVVIANPSAVLPNQNIRLSGYGFGYQNRRRGQIVSLTLGGQEIDPQRVNGGGGLPRLDSQGRWQATVSLPLDQTVAGPGKRTLRARDEFGWVGETTVVFPQRQVTLTPIWGRPGTRLTVSGAGFPARNVQASDTSITITYQSERGQSLAVAETNAAGQFEAELTIPRGVPAPSTNQVQVEFVDDRGERITTLVYHSVPGATVAAEPADGPPGTAVALLGEGFRAFTPVSRVLVGTVDVTPAPRPYTDEQGTVALEVVLPHVSLGAVPVTVEAGGHTASGIVQVVMSGNIPGDSEPTAEALASLGDNFVRLFHFDNDAKTWSFYDPQAEEASSRKHLITGQAYWLLVQEQAIVSLNGKTRPLTCVARNCWNLIVW